MRRRLFRFARGIALSVALAAGTGTPASAADWKEAQKEFKDAIKSSDWKTRRQGYIALMDQDRGEAVEEVLAAMAKEENPAVLMAGIRTMSLWMSGEATAAMSGVIRKEKGPRRVWTLLAMGDSKIDGGKDALVDVVKGTDPQGIALAALALGKKQIGAAVPRLVECLKHKDWEVRSACARALKSMTTYLAKADKQAIVDALAAAEGRERGDLVDLLQTLSAQDFGWDVAAWKAWAAGDPVAGIQRNPKRPAYVVGIPIYGRRVVVVLDTSICTEDPVPFTDRARLQDLCKVPGARDVPWFNIKTTGQFYNAHAKRFVTDLPDGTPFDLVIAGKTPKAAFGKLTALTAAARAVVEKDVEDLKPANGMDAVEALTMALDSGGKDPAAWASGPEEIVVLACGLPWLAPVTDQAVVGATIALKARARVVSIHTVGVGAHASEMMKTLAEATGGRYLSLQK